MENQVTVRKSSMKDLSKGKEETQAKLKQAQELIFEAISLETGDTVEEIKAFYKAIQETTGEDAKPTGRQHTMFTNIVGNDDIVGVCMIIGYQKADSKTENVAPINQLTAMLLEPLGLEILVPAVMLIQSKQTADAKPSENAGSPIEQVEAEAPSAIDGAVTSLETPEDSEEVVVGTEVEEDTVVEEYDATETPVDEDEIPF